MVIEFTPISKLWAKNESLIDVVKSQFQEDMRTWFSELKKLVGDRLGDLELHEDIKPGSLYWWVGHPGGHKQSASLWIRLFSTELITTEKLVFEVYCSELDEDIQDAIRSFANIGEMQSFCFVDHRPSVALRVELDLKDDSEIYKVADKISLVFRSFAEIPNFPMA